MAKKKYVLVVEQVSKMGSLMLYLLIQTYLASESF